MSDDIIEIRQIRRKISEECGHNVHKAADYYRQIEQELRKSGDFRFEELIAEAVTLERKGALKKILDKVPDRDPLPGDEI